MNTVLQDLYDSEINFSIVTFWDSGFEVQLGDEMNGFDAQTHCDTFAEVVNWLRDTAIDIYPKSLFTKKYSNLN